MNCAPAGRRQHAESPLFLLPHGKKRTDRDEYLDHRVVIFGWRKVLPDRQQIAADVAQILHHVEYFGLGLAQADHDAGLGQNRSMASFDLGHKARDR